ncbi:MAG: sigma-70 family RNA polymerase sigma factor [Rhodospirillales bacterium]|nr:sigma-70 family RNA polymerase sigma factor [Rhodospirillales bacterium]
MLCGPEQRVSKLGPHESDLVAVGRNGDRVAFRRLFEHFAPRLHSFLLRKNSSPALAEDVVQDVFASVWRRSSTFDPSKASASTWIFTIARNRRIDLARRARPEVDINDPATVPEEADHSPLPDERANHSQMSRLLANAVTTLPKEQSDLIAMAYQRDMSHSEIADELGLPLGTVKSRLRLALNKLRHAMEGLQ